MKKIILLLILLTSIEANSQISFPLRTERLSEVYSLINEIATITNYKLTKLDSSSNDKRIIRYSLSNGNNIDTITIVFLKRIIGGNAALELSGHFEYSFTELKGRYLDIFPLWKYYINKSADLKIVAEKGWDVSGSDYKQREEGWYSRVNFRPFQANYWRIW